MGCNRVYLSQSSKMNTLVFLFTLVFYLFVRTSGGASPSWYHGPDGLRESAVIITEYNSPESGSAYESAESTDHEAETDEHKPLFPLDASDYIGFLCGSLGLMLAAGGGIGGGGMLVPLYILVMGFSPKHAIPLSNVTVFGGACANFYLNRSKRHPKADRPLMDWDLILIMQPMTIAGALLGSFVNKILPELVLTICLVLLLAYTTHGTLKKGFQTFDRETQSKTVENVDQDTEDQKTGLLEAEDGGESTQKTSEEASKPLKASDLARRELETIIEEERDVPSWKWQTIWAVFVVVIVVNLVKGGGHLDSPLGITCGSPGYWISSGIMFGWILFVSHFIRTRLVALTVAKKRLGYEYVEGDIAWDNRATVVYPLVCIGAGMCAGMFGIGGGIIQVPLMLQMGVNPKVASASSATMILYTSFTALTSFYVYGLLVEDYAVMGFILGLIVTFVGQIGLNVLIKQFGRDSLIIFSVAAVVGLSALLMGTHSAISLASGELNLSLGSVC